MQESISARPPAALPAALQAGVERLAQAADELAEAARDLDDCRGRESTRMVLAIADVAAEIEPIAARLEAMLAAYLVASVQVGDDGREEAVERLP